MNTALHTLIGQRLSRRGQYVFIGVLLLAVIIEGIDIQLLSLTSPLLLAEWQLARSALGPAMSAALVGMGLGALIGGWLGDRVGRKRVVVASVLCFGLATVLVSTATDLWQVTALRLIGGLGFGAIAPNTMALFSEWLRGPLRIKAMSLLSIGTPLGGALGAAVLMGLLTRLGWRGSFALFGALSALAAVAIVRIVPESSAFLTARGRFDEAARVVSRWIGKPVDARELRDAGTASSPVASDASSVLNLGVSLRCVAGTSLCAIGTAYVAYACIAWLPVLFTTQGLTLQRSLSAMFWFNLCALSSSVATAYLVGWLGSKRLMLFATAGVGLALLLMHLLLGRGAAVVASSPDWSLALATGLIGGSTGTLLTTLYLVIALRYPAPTRSTGLGLAMTLGRIGAIAATYFGGALLGSAATASQAFYLALVAGTACAVVGIVVADRHVEPGLLARPDAS